MFARATPLHAVVFAIVLSTISVGTRVAFDAGSNALTVVAIRNGFGTLLVLLFLAAMRAPLGMAPRERNIAFAIGLLLGLNNITLNLALERVPVPVAILTFYTYPVWITIWSWMRGHEPFRAMGLLGVVLAFIGLALTLGVGTEIPDLTGVAMALFSCLLWASVMLLSTRHLAAVPPNSRTLYMMGSASALILLALAVLGTPALPHTTAGIAALAWVPLAYGFGMLGMLWMTSRMGPMRASFFMNIEPISSIALSALVLGQTLTGLQLVGAALVIVSLVIFRPPPKADTAATPAT